MPEEFLRRQELAMPKPISVQLYSLRDAARKDFPAVLKAVADIGYIGVEPAGFWNVRPSEFIKIIADLGLKMYSSHTPWARPGVLGEAMDLADRLGLKKIVCGYSPDDFKDRDAIRRTADTTNEMMGVLKKNGFILFQHNHYWEFDRLDGKLKYDIYRNLCPGIKFQMDCFWSANLGRENPAEMLKEFAADTVSIHMKDGVVDQKAKVAGMKNGILDCQISNLSLGTGTLPIKDLIPLVPDAVDTVIVELDYCGIDMLTAIRQSYEFMTRNRLALGGK